MKLNLFSKICLKIALLLSELLSELLLKNILAIKMYLAKDRQILFMTCIFYTKTFF